MKKEPEMTTHHLVKKDITKMLIIAVTAVVILIVLFFLDQKFNFLGPLAKRLVDTLY